MKLKTLAIAVAVASMPFAAQADLKISGDIGVGYMQSKGNKNAVDDNGVAAPKAAGDAKKHPSQRCLYHSQVAFIQS